MSTSTALTDLWTLLGDRAGDDVLALYTRLRDAGASPEELSRALSMAITAQNLHAGAMAEGVARQQLEQWGVPDTSAVPARKLSHNLDRARLAGAVTTVLERVDPEDVVAALAVAGRTLHKIARSEAVEAAQRTFRDKMTRSPHVKGWTRQLESGACELCTWWERDGRVWPAEHTMPTHKGCTCAQEFVRTDEVQTVSDAAHKASEERAAAGSLRRRRQVHEGTYSSRSSRGEQ